MGHKIQNSIPVSARYFCKGFHVSFLSELHQCCERKSTNGASGKYAIINRRKSANGTSRKYAIVNRRNSANGTSRKYAIVNRSSSRCKYAIGKPSSRRRK